MSENNTLNIVNAASKFRQNEDTLKRMAEKCLGKPVWDFHAQELGGGMCNAVYLIQADRQKYVIKIAPQAEPGVLMRHEENSLLNEANMLHLLNERLDIPAPRLIHLDTTREICGADYFMMSFVEGIPLSSMNPKPTDNEISRIKRDVGVICRKISSIHGNKFGIPALQSTHRDNNADFILLLVEMLLKDAADANITIPGITHTGLLALIGENRSVLNDNVFPRYIHTDTWDGNLMIKDNKLTGLIDYAAVFCGDELMHHDFHDFGELNPAFTSGYGKTQFTHSEKIRISVYKIWQRLGMIVECGYRKYDDPNMYSWVHGEFSREVEHLADLISLKNQNG